MTESFKGKLGGKRPGSGRKKGPMTVQGITKELAIKSFNERVAKSTDALFNAAKTVAVGQMFVYRMDEEERGAGKNKYTVKVPKLVTDPDELNEAIDKLYGNGESEEYYFVTTKEPDIKAIDSLMNRAHGRPKESVEHSGEIKGLVGLITQLNNDDREED